MGRQKEKIKATIDLVKDKSLADSLEKFVKQNNFDKLRAESKQIRVSLVMLVKNQKDNILEVLEEVRKLDLEELHVIDTGSDDGTTDIIKNLKFINYHEMTWIEDYALMRNEASKFSSTDWILTLDSDEILKTEHVDLKLLIFLLTKVITIPFSISFEQHFPGQSSFGVPARIYNRSHSYYYGLVHEELRETNTHIPVPSIQTRILIENKGSTDEEITKFSKTERYSALLKRMMEIEPDNPRWFSYLPAESTQEMILNGSYEKYLNYFLFKNNQYILDVTNIKWHDYTKVLIQKYVSLFIIENKLEEAINLSMFALKVFPNNTYLMFYISLSKIEKVKQSVKKALKEELTWYLSLDKSNSYDEDYRDTQLLEVTLAELNLLNGQSEAARTIVSNLTDQKVLELWQHWHRGERSSK